MWGLGFTSSLRPYLSILGVASLLTVPPLTFFVFFIPLEPSVE